MKRLLPLLILLAVAHAGDAFTWDPSQRPVPVKGARFVEEAEKTDSRSMRISVNEELQSDDERLDGTEMVRLEHLVGAVSSGTITEDAIHVAKWSRGTRAGAPDTCLEGALLKITGEGAARSYAIETDHPVTPSAKGWITTNLVKGGKGQPGLDELDCAFLYPRERVSEGGTWKLDALAVAREIMGPATEIDAARSHVTGRLTKVSVATGVHVGHIEVEAALALGTLGPSKVEWKEGGVLSVRWTLEASLEPARRDELAGTVKIELAGKGTLTPPGNAPVQLTMDWKSTVHVKRRPLD